MSVLIMGQWRWGHGKDLQEAKKNFRKQGALLSNGYAVIEFPEPLTFKGVDQMGSFHWNQNGSETEPIITEVEPLRKTK